MESQAGPSGKPPRPEQALSEAGTDVPPPYEAVWNGGAASNTNWARDDPRSSSQQSLVPEYDEQRSRRTLLLIYIHGFMGNEMSFRSFPAHVHNLLTVLLADSHIVHTKVYPRYRSKKKITVARDDFSKWLEPHESSTTDVVLLGHSMGGLLSAEVVLLAPEPPANRAFKHRILGTINLDVPFLGLHPGIVRSGLASIFKPSEETHQDKYNIESGDAFWSQNDPNFNPNYTNDVTLPTRTGWANAWHWVNKHSDNLSKAAQNLVSSHMEFGGAMAHMNELKSRYVKLRSLEEQSEAVRRSVVTSTSTPSRVRFINYYTASHGRPKAAKPTNDEEPAEDTSERQELANVAEGLLASTGSPTADEEPESKNAEQGDAQKGESIADVPSPPRQGSGESSTNSHLPPLPDVPTAPPPLDLSFIQDKETRKLVEKEHSRAVKLYEKALKERESAVKDREKFEEKRAQREKKEAEEMAKKDGKKAEKSAKKAAEEAEEAAKRAAKANKKASKKPESEMTHSEREHLRLENERLRMEAEGRRMRGEKEPEAEPGVESYSAASSSRPSINDISARTSSLSIQPTPSSSSAQSHNKRPSLGTAESSASGKKDKRPPKDRKFCNLPPKDSQGQRDPCWVRVFMEGVDEVGAHCGLFFIDERYERMVGEIAETVEKWVHEDRGEAFVADQKR